MLDTFQPQQDEVFFFRARCFRSRSTSSSARSSMSCRILLMIFCSFGRQPVQHVSYRIVNILIIILTSLEIICCNL